MKIRVERKFGPTHAPLYPGEVLDPTPEVAAMLIRREWATAIEEPEEEKPKEEDESEGD